MGDTRGSGASGRLGMAREATALARDLLVALLVLVVVVKPAMLKSWLSALGVSKATIFGVELTPGNEKELGEELDQLKQQRDAAIFELNSVKMQVADARGEIERLKGGDPAVTAALSSIQVPAAPPSSGGFGAGSSWVESARQAIDSGGRWAVVYSGDATLQGAQDEMKWAKENKVRNAAIFHRQDSYRSVLLADSPEAADALLGTARKRRKDAYVVNMQSWCPSPSQQRGYQECPPAG